MSHHFDSKLARDNPSLSICDMYLFKGAPGCTAMIMTVNADVGLSASDTFPDEGLYAFRFDLNGDAREERRRSTRVERPRASTEHSGSFPARGAIP
jgi:hypothetical protein